MTAMTPAGAVDRALGEPRGPTLAEVQSWPATVDVRRAACALGISSSWAYQLVAQGAFPARVLTIGRRSRVMTASLLTLLEGGNVQ